MVRAIVRERRVPVFPGGSVVFQARGSGAGRLTLVSGLTDARQTGPGRTFEVLERGGWPRQPVPGATELWFERRREACAQCDAQRWLLIRVIQPIGHCRSVTVRQFEEHLTGAPAVALEWVQDKAEKEEKKRAAKKPKK